MRFFTRAIEIYEAGLRKFPNNFDLAYNKSVTSLLWFAGSPGPSCAAMNCLLTFPELEYSTRLQHTQSL